MDFDTDDTAVHQLADRVGAVRAASHKKSEVKRKRLTSTQHPEDVGRRALVHRDKRTAHAATDQGSETGAEGMMALIGANKVGVDIDTARGNDFSLHAFDRSRITHHQLVVRCGDANWADTGAPCT